MNSTLKISLITLACFMVAGVIVANMRHSWESQHQMEKRIDDLQKQVAEHAAPQTAPAAMGAPAASPANAAATSGAQVVLQSAGAGEYVEKQRNIKDIMDAGWKLINKKDPAAASQAADIFQQGLDKVDDKSPDLYNGLGRALLIAGKPREAVDAWEKGLAIAPKFADMQSGIGWACWRVNEPYYALKAWEAAVAIDPKCVDAWSGLAWVDMALGKKDQAVQGFQTLYAFDRRTDWFNGLTLARSGNRDPAKFAVYFPLPPLEAFNAAASKPSTGPVSASIPASF